MVKKDITTNYIYNLSYQILSLLIPVFTTPYISRVLGADGIGTYSYTYSIVTYFTLVAALGTTTYAQREIAYCQQEPQKYTTIFWEIIFLRGILSLICGILYLFLIWNTEDFLIGLVQGIYLIGTATDVSWFFQGMEEFSKTVMRNFFIKIINLIFIFLCVKTKNDLYLYVFGMTFLPVIGNISLWLYLPYFLVKKTLFHIHPFRHLKYTMQLFIPTVAIQIYTVLDKTMLGIFTESRAQNGYYEQSDKLVRLLLTLVTSLGTVMGPRVSSTFACGDYNTLKTYMRKTYQFVWFISIPLCLGLIVISSIFVPWFFGNGYENVTILLQIFSFLLIAVGLNNITGIQYLIPIKKQDIFTITVIIGAVINFFLNLYLIPRYMANGAAIASVIAETAITISQFIYVIYIKKDFTWKDILGKSYKYLFAGSVMAGVVEILKFYVQNSFFNMCILAIIGIMIYLILLLVLKDDFLFDLLRHIIEQNKKRK